MARLVILGLVLKGCYLLKLDNSILGLLVIASQLDEWVTWEMALNKLIGFCIALLSCQLLWAEVVPGNVEKQSALQGGYRLALSSVNKVNNQLSIEVQHDLQVSGSRKLYRLSADANLQMVFNQTIAKLSAKALYQCVAQECGSSNLWANNIFKEFRLYGRDKKQWYWVGQKADHIWILYCVQRGNKRNYCLLDDVAVLSGLPENIASPSQLLGEDYVLVPEGGEKEQLGWLKKHLSVHADKQYYLVKHLASVVPFDQYSIKYQQYLGGLTGLISSLPESMRVRLSAQVVLGLAPDKDKKDRLVLVWAKD